MAHLYNLSNQAEMEELVGLLELLEQDEKIESNPDNYLTETDNECIIAIGHLADKYLITADGDVNWDNVKFVREWGEFEVFPVERDRFGWLLGGIQTSKGIITFG